MSETAIRDHLIAAGVRNLRKFGYPSCDAKNILTDAVYKQFFASMLRENEGTAGATVDKVISTLLREIEGGSR